MDASDYNSLRGRYTRCLELLHTALQRQTDAESRADDYEKLNAKLQSDDAQLKSRIRNLSDTNSQLQAQVQSLKEELAAPKIVDETRQSGKRIEELEAQLSEYRQKLDNQEEEITSLKRRLQQTITETHTLQTKLSEAEAQLAESAKLNQKTSSHLRVQLKEAEERSQEANSSMINLTDELDRVRRVQETYKINLKIEKASRQELETELSLYKSKLEKLHQQVVQLRTDRNEYRELHQQMQNTIDQLRRRLEETQAARQGSMFAEFVQVKRENHQLSNQVESLSRVAKTLQDPLKRFHAQRSQRSAPAARRSTNHSRNIEVPLPQRRTDNERSTSQPPDRLPNVSANGTSNASQYRSVSNAASASTSSRLIG